MSFAEQQPAVASLLQRSLERGRLAHAYLFAGPRGSGKEAMARTLAKALNCESASFDSCDRCDSCRRIDQGSHPDVYWLRPESKSRRITVEQIREFEKAISLRSTMARLKIGVIMDAECMGEEASNAFLKTLEEPPGQTIILLLTAESQRLLATIISRCLKITFGPGSARLESPYRQKVLPLLQEFSHQDSNKIVRAYRLLAGLTAVLNEARETTRSRVEAQANLDRYDEIESAVREKLEDQMTARIEGEYRAERERVLEDVYGWFGDVLLANQNVDRGLFVYPELATAAAATARTLSFDQAAANVDAVEQIRELLRRNISEPLAFEVCLLKLN